MGFREKMKQLRRSRDGGVLNICNEGIAVAQFEDMVEGEISHVI
jgi:hypothetical protein